ncbi:MAG: PfkB family carbohydrate kinase [Candidatus Krumholzibacteriota bacterium]|nr:PfkB family carbohydrate kinase [Candidatus Krumholzibacteriota bacterium]
MNLVIVGSVAFDSIETPQRRVEKVLGGSAVYASMAACYQLPVRLVGVAGEDFTPEYIDIISMKNIDITGLEIVEGGKTFFWKGKYGDNPNERETLVTELNVFENFRPALPGGWEKSEWVFLANIDPELQLNLLNQFKGDPFVGCDTMNFWIEGKPGVLSKVLQRVNLLFINDSEARQLSRETDLIRAARRILKLGPEIVVVKKGEHGAFMLTEDFLFISPAYPIDNLLDPTGAGDSFAGGFFGFLAANGDINEKNLRRSMIYGTVLASFTCEDFSVNSIRDINLDMIKERFNRIVDFVKIDKEEI